MPSLFEVIGEALQAYWFSPLSLSVLAVCGASIGTLLYVFVTNAQNAKLRVSLLTGLYALSIFFWAFIAASLVLCVSQARMIAYARFGVPVAVFGAVAGGLTASTLISFLVWHFGNKAVLRRFPLRDLRAEEGWIGEYLSLLARFEGLRGVRLRIVESGGKEPHILVSQGLTSFLDPDELETVVAHEVMHLKHHDAEFKVFSKVLSRILFFDPFSKFFDPAVHREREYLADETSARSTGKPAALASALLKIVDRGAPTKATWGLSIYAPGRGLFSRYPPIDERVHRLLLLSDLLATR